jgi:hypothetical protein
MESKMTNNELTWHDLTTDPPPDATDIDTITYLTYPYYRVLYFWDGKFWESIGYTWISAYVTDWMELPPAPKRSEK